MIRLLLAAVLALVAALAQAQAQTSERFSFAIIGDTPYSIGEEWMFADMLKDLDREDLAFVVHIGDFKNGRSPCTDELFAQRLQQFQSVRHPFIYVPGDNEWTDCHRSGTDPLERLAKLRELFYPDDNSLGARKLKLVRQSADPRFAEYRENVRWVVDGVMFIGLNVQGSNDNFGRTPQMDAEHEQRRRADTEWLRQSFDLAQKNAYFAVFIAMQADPYFDRPNPSPPNSSDVYATLKQELLAHTLAFGKPVVLIHGDTHRFRVDQPLVDPATQKPVENFTRIESFGSPWVDWIRVRVDPADPNLLAIKTGREINPPR